MNTKFFTVSIIRLNTGQLGNQARALFSEYLNPSSLKLLVNNRSMSRR